MCFFAFEGQPLLQSEGLDIESTFYQVMRSGQRTANSATEYLRWPSGLTNEVDVDGWTMEFALWDLHDGIHTIEFGR